MRERRSGLLEERGLSDVDQSPGAVDKTEWVSQIRTVSTVLRARTSSRRSLHPNYWGQLAFRNCVRRAYNGGAVQGGTCTRTGSGLTAAGEPVMGLG